MKPLKLTPNEQGIISATELTNAILTNQPIELIDGLLIEGDVKCNSVDYQHRLVINNTIFKGCFDLSETHFSRSVDLSGCSFEKNVNFSAVQVDCNLTLTNAKISSSCEPPDSWRLKSFERIRVQGVLDARGLKAKVVLNFNHSQIGKLLLCSYKERTECKDVRLLGARILYQLDCSGIKIDDDLILQGADIQSDLFCNTSENYRTEVGGDVCLVGAKILGRADLSGIKIAGNLALECADIQGALDFKPEKDSDEQWHHTEIAGYADLGGAKISPLVNLSGAKIVGYLSLQAAEIKGNLFCLYHPETERSTQIGEFVDFTGIYVTKSIRLGGAEIEGDLNLQGAEVKGDLCFRVDKNVKATIIKGNANLVEVKVLGSIHFGGTQIGGNLDLKRAEIKSKLGFEVGGDYPTKIEKNLNLAGAKLLGNLDLSGLKVGADLILKGVEILGSVDTNVSPESRQKPPQAVIGGRVNLNRARVSSSVDLTGVKIKKNLDLTGASLASNLYLSLNQIEGNANIKECSIHNISIDIKPSSNTNQLVPNTKLDLSFAKVVSLKIKYSLPKELNLEGFEFQHIELPETSRGGNRYIEFLGISQPFDKGAYLYVEDWLRCQGGQIDANRVYVAMRRRNKDIKVSSSLDTFKGRFLLFLQRSVERLLSITIAYGTETYRLFFIYFIPALLISSLLFGDKKSVELDWAVTAQDLRNPQIVERFNPQEPRLKDEPPIFPKIWSQKDAFWLALRVTLPIISIGSTDKWVPSSQNIELFRHETPVTYRDYALSVTLLSWIAVPLFLAGVSGIVKKRS